MAMCVFENVVCDTKMSLGTSSSTAAIVFVFLGLRIVYLDGLCDSMMFRVTSCSPLRFPGIFWGHADGTSCCDMLIYDDRYLGHPRG